jgi:biopolymer transport protein ExbB/TolQ
VLELIIGLAIGIGVLIACSAIALNINRLAKELAENFAESALGLLIAICWLMFFQIVLLVGILWRTW